MGYVSNDTEAASWMNVEDVEFVLSRSRWPVIRWLRVEVRDGTVTLYGTVRSYHEKQIVQREILDMPGVRALDDQLEVISV